jgi:DNA-binding beta-propeller fold protein YncE
MRSRSAIASAAIAVALLAASFVQISSAAASGGTLLWVAQTKVGPYGWAEGMSVSPDGSRAYVTGTRQKVGHSYDFVTVAYDTSTGTEIWATRYDNAMHTADSAWAIKVSPDGSRVIVLGQSRTGGRGIGGFDYTTVAYDAATGAQLWVAGYDGPSHRDDRPVALDVSPDGSSVFVTGRSNGLGTRSDYATVAYDAATGAQLWVARWGAVGVAYDDAWAVAVSPDASRVIVTGSSLRFEGRRQYRAVTIAYSATTGAELWLRRSSRGEVGSAGFSLAISPDGSRVYVTGGRFGGASDSLSTIAYDMGDGAEEWAARYDRDGPWPMFTDVAPDGSHIYVSSQNATTALEGSSGGKVWADPTALGVAGMALQGDGSHLYIGGYIDGSMEAIAYDPTSGAKEWTSTYGTRGGGGLVARSIATTPDGSKVLVSGYGVVDGNADFVTVAYSTA